MTQDAEQRSTNSELVSFQGVVPVVVELNLKRICNLSGGNHDDNGKR